jgi:hypothetical protein
MTLLVADGAATEATQGKIMGAPSKAVLNKLANPAHAKVSRRHGIDLHR